MNDNAKRRRGRFPQTLFVRASAEEKAAILARAAQARLSASRYLVRGGLDGRAPPGEGERLELERLLRLFVRAQSSLTRLLSDTRQWMRMGADPGLETELQEVLSALSALIQRLRERLTEG